MAKAPDIGSILKLRSDEGFICSLMYTWVFCPYTSLKETEGLVCVRSNSLYTGTEIEFGRNINIWHLIFMFLR